MRLSDRLDLQVLSQPSMWSICRAGMRHNCGNKIVSNYGQYPGYLPIRLLSGHKSQLHDWLTNAILWRQFATAICNHLLKTGVSRQLSLSLLLPFEWQYHQQSVKSMILQLLVLSSFGLLPPEGNKEFLTPQKLLLKTSISLFSDGWHRYVINHVLKGLHIWRELHTIESGYL